MGFLEQQREWQQERDAEDRRWRQQQEADNRRCRKQEMWVVVGGSLLGVLLGFATAMATIWLGYMLQK